MSDTDPPDSTKDGASVPLKSYRSLGQGMAVEFRCQTCGAWFDVELEAVISQLQARGVGGSETGIKAVGSLAERPCRCGALRFETRPSFPQMPNMPKGHSS